MMNQDDLEDYRLELEIKYVDESSLDFSTSDISVEDLLAITALLQSKIKFTKLDLSFKELGTEVIGSIISSLKNIEDFVSFDLTSNLILGEDYGLLTPYLLTAINLQELDLSFNSLEDGALIDQLKDLAKLKELNLDSTDISGLNILELAGTIKRLTSLERLFLATNEICGEGLALLAASLPRKLVHLNLESNLIDDKGIIALAAVLPNIPSLKILNVSYNNISDKGLKVLADVLPNTKLEVLSLQAINVSASTENLILALVNTNCNFVTKIEGLRNSSQINARVDLNRSAGYVAALILEGQAHLPEVLANLVNSYLGPLATSIKLASVLGFLPRQLTMNMDRLSQISSRLLHQNCDEKTRYNHQDSKLPLSEGASQDNREQDNFATHHR
jgi:hypothetical protein